MCRKNDPPEFIEILTTHNGGKYIMAMYGNLDDWWHDHLEVFTTT